MRQKIMFMLSAVCIFAAGCSTTSESSRPNGTGAKVAKQVVKMGLRRSPLAVIKAVK